MIQYIEVVGKRKCSFYCQVG